jgi:hypothetical protein
MDIMQVMKTEETDNEAALSSLLMLSKSNQDSTNSKLIADAEVILSNFILKQNNFFAFLLGKSKITPKSNSLK